MREVLGDPGLWRPVWLVEALVASVLAIVVITSIRFARTEPVQGRFSLTLLRGVPGWARATVAYALFGVVTSGFGAFVLAALEDDGGLSRGTATIVFSAMGLTAAVGAPVIGALSDRFGRPQLMMFAMTMLTAACLIVGFGRGPVVAVGAVLYGAFAGSFPAVLATYVRDHIDQREFSGAFATMTLLFSVVVISVPGLVGTLADATGSFTAPFGLLAVAGMGAVIVVAGLPRVGTTPGADRASLAR
jgi:MFS family permease